MFLVSNAFNGPGLAQTHSVAFVQNVTVTGNSAPAGLGGGIRNAGGTVPVPISGGIHIENTNGANSLSGGECSRNSNAFTVDRGGNLASDGTCLGLRNSSNFVHPAGNDPPNQLNTDPMLGGLANNGGLTLTHMPLAGSPAIDNGNS